MKILIVSSVPSHPTNAGNRTAILNLTELFKSLGHTVKFLYIDEQPLLSNRKNLTELKDYWEEDLITFQVSRFEHGVHLFKQKYRQYFQNGITKVDDYYPFSLNSFLKKLQKNENFDCCIVNYYFLSKALTLKEFPLMGVYTHDYFAYKGILVGNKKVGYGTDANQEAIAMQRAKHIFALNTEEAIYFNKLSPFSAVYNVFNTFVFTKTNFVGNKNILFFSGDNPYNINGIKWFLEAIFPLIIEKDPQINLIIGGGICKALKDINHSNIKLLGYVENPIDFYNLGDIVINPTYQGTGLKIKTFEAISYGKVVLAHPHSVVGIYNPSGAPVFASTNAKEWVDYLMSLFTDHHKILEIKEQDDIYIKNMNDFVINEFNQFFNSHR